jgi:hypothetical protein
MWLALAATLLLFTSDPSWRDKPPAQWTDTDAKALLGGSPWVGTAQLQRIPPRSPFMRRDSGDWDTGVGTGVGFEGVIGLFGHESTEAAIARARQKADLGTIPIVWASAAPVHAAEKILGATNTPDFGPNYYAVALLNIPAESRLNPGHLKNLASIRRAGMKDFRAVRAQILEHGDGRATVIYLFPRSVEISVKDPMLTFVAQIGEVFISSFFYPDRMTIDGHLEL